MNHKIFVKVVTFSLILLLSVLFLPTLAYSTTFTGVVKFTDHTWARVSYYQTGNSSVYVELSDPDLNTNSAVVESVTLSVTSTTETAATVSEPLTLTETGLNTGIFHGSLPIALGATAGLNGTLAVKAADQITVTYQDASDDWGGGVTATASSLMVQTKLTSGSLAANTTWSLADSPFLVTGDISVGDGITLTIEPGVTIFFQPFTDDQSNGYWDSKSELRILSGGHLQAVGTSTAPIHFTSISDLNVPETWGGIFFSDGTGSLSYCQLEFAYYGVYAESPGADPLIDHCQITNSNYGIYINSHANPTIQNSTISGATN